MLEGDHASPKTLALRPITKKEKTQCASIGEGGNEISKESKHTQKK